ncbi:MULTISPECIES: hypothetical protein [Chitinophagaceae]
MFIDYQKLVVQDYEKKRAANQLPLNLSQPTPAKLKEASLIVCEKRYRREDGRILGDFFGEGNDKEATLKAIKKFEPDKFKQLRKFLNDSNLKTSEKNIELLAWLIDFEKRPFEHGKNYEEERSEEIATIVLQKNEEEETQEKTETQTVARAEAIPTPQTVIQNQAKQKSLITGPIPAKAFLEPTEPIKPKTSLKSTLSAIILMVIIGVIYWTVKEKKSNSGNCMYWNVDHYEQIACAPAHGDTLVIALDSARLLHFRKIMHPDTITYNDIGKIWYLKSNGNIEFFTSSGYHPVEIRRQLKPVTLYIIDQYVRDAH